MIIHKRAHFLKKDLERARNAGLKIGFVPTMGALHQGHLSLLKTSKQENDLTVCSIYVNPKQFNNQNDFEFYPKTIEKDIEALISADTEILFLPNFEEIYGNEVQQMHDLGDLDTKIEGEFRPGHFQGVAEVVKRFFELINPENSYFGQKDLQQVLVIKKLISAYQLNVKLKVVPIFRESTGLAMSSRNIRLSPVKRERAGFVFRSLLGLKEDIKSMDLVSARKKAIKNLQSEEGSEIDYMEIIDMDTMNPILNGDDHQNIAAVTVVNYGGVRLLDNIILKGGF